jgi:hypothetical protein
VEKGGRDARLLAADPILEPIRGDPRFQATLEDLRRRVARMRAVALDQR